MLTYDLKYRNTYNGESAKILGTDAPMPVICSFSLEYYDYADKFVYIGSIDCKEVLPIGKVLTLLIGPTEDYRINFQVLGDDAHSLAFIGKIYRKANPKYFPKTKYKTLSE